jgi:hypothetical protein
MCEHLSLSFQEDDLSEVSIPLSVLSLAVLLCLSVLVSLAVLFRLSVLLSLPVSVQCPGSGPEVSVRHIGRVFAPCTNITVFKMIWENVKGRKFNVNVIKS